MNWFLELVVMSLEAIEYHPVAEEQAQTQEDSEISRTSYGNSLLLSSRYGPDCWELGPVLLLEVVDFYCSVVVLGSNGGYCSGQGTQVIRVTRESDVRYARFGMSLEVIGDQTWMDPVPGVRGMLRPAGIKLPLLEMKADVIRSRVIGKKCTEIGRSQRWSLLEWGRMNPLELRKFFERMRREVGFQWFYSSLYDGMRLIYRRNFDEKVTDIKYVENVLNQAVKLSFSEETSRLKMVELEAMVRRKSVTWLTGLFSDWEFEERMKWREDVLRLPGLKRRSGVKRAGSSPGGKPGRSKRRRMRPSRGVPNVEEVFRLSPLQVYLQMEIYLETLAPALNRMKRRKR